MTKSSILYWKHKNSIVNIVLLILKFVVEYVASVTEFKQIWQENTNTSQLNLCQNYFTRLPRVFPRSLIESSSSSSFVCSHLMEHVSNVSWLSFKETRLRHWIFRATILAVTAYLDAFQKIADAATGARGEHLFTSSTFFLFFYFESRRVQRFMFHKTHGWHLTVGVDRDLLPSILLLGKILASRCFVIFCVKWKEISLLLKFPRSTIWFSTKDDIDDSRSLMLHINQSKNFIV